MVFWSGCAQSVSDAVPQRYAGTQRLLGGFHPLSDARLIAGAQRLEHLLGERTVRVAVQFDVAL